MELKSSKLIVCFLTIPCTSMSLKTQIRSTSNVNWKSLTAASDEFFIAGVCFITEEKCNTMHMHVHKKCGLVKLLIEFLY